MRAVLLLLLVLAVPGLTQAQTEIRRVGANIEVRAQSAPLSEVLDRLARETGMKVVYEGAPPRVRVTLVLPPAPPAQAVLAVLEGHGLTYMARMDPTGTRVETLYVVTATGTAAPPAGAARREMRAQDPPEDEEPAEEPEPEPVPAAEPAPDMPQRERPDRQDRLRQGGSDVPPPDDGPRPGMPFTPGVIGPLRMPTPGGQAMPGPLRLPTGPPATTTPNPTEN